MRTVPILVLLLMLSAARTAQAQSFELFGAAGPTLVDAGNSLAIGAGVTPTSTWSFRFNVERTHLSTRINRYENGFATFRGGTLLLGSAEAQFVPLGRHRAGPYGLAGIAAGEWRANVNDLFPGPANTYNVRTVFAGGGIQIPFRERLAFFGDVRWMIGADENEGLVAVAPIRAGLTFRF